MGVKFMGIKFKAVLAARPFFAAGPQVSGHVAGGVTGRLL
jgi:hypothetical protein